MAWYAETLALLANDEEFDSGCHLMENQLHFPKYENRMPPWHFVDWMYLGTGCPTLNGVNELFLGYWLKLH